MSLTITNVGYARNTALTGGGNNYWTASTWFKRTATTGEMIMGFNAASAVWDVGYNAASVKFYIVGAGWVTNDTDFAVADGEWVYLTATCDSRYLSLYAFREGSSTPTTVKANADNFIAFPVTRFYLGSHDTGGYYSHPGSYRYGRMWSSATSGNGILTTGEMAAQMASATVVSDGNTNIVAWALPDGTTTTDDSGQGNTATLAGASTGGDEPDLAGGASAAISPSILRPNQSTVFGSAAQRFT